MKPLMLILDGHNFIDYPAGGQLTFQKNLLSTPFDEMSVKLVGLTTDPKEQPGVWSERRIADRSYPFLPVHRMKPVRGKPAIPIRIRYTYGSWICRSQLHQENPALYYTHNPEMIYPLLDRPINFIYHIHGSPLRAAAFSRYRQLQWPIAQKLYYSMVKKVISRAAKLIWVSHDGFEESLSLFPDIEKKSVILPNSVDTRHFAPQDKEKARKRSGFSGSGPIAVFLGRLSAVKGLDLVFRSLRLIRQSGIPLRLALVGTGEEEETLRKLARTLELEDYILFLGHRDLSEIPSLLSCADIALFGSQSEGFSLALIECLACGLPVVTTNAGDAAQIIRDFHNGALVHSRKEDAYAEAVISVLKRGTSAMTLNCIQTAHLYSNETFTRKFKNIVSEVL